MYRLYFLISMLQLSFGIPLQQFYPFGISADDSSLVQTDDDAERIQLSFTFLFFDTGYNSLFVRQYIQ